MYDWSTYRRTGRIHSVIPAKAKPFIVHLVFITSIGMGSVFLPVFGELYGQTLKICQQLCSFEIPTTSK